MRRAGLLAAVTLVVGAAGVMVALDPFGSPVGAAQFDVDTTVASDDAVPGDGLCADAGGACSLRAALMEAETLGGDHVIAVPVGTHRLGGPIDVSANIELRGESSSTSIIDLEGQRGFTTSANAFGLTRLTVTGGRGLSESGSAISATFASVSIDDVVFRDNETDGNGAVVDATGGLLTVIDGEFRENVAADGGAIAALGTAIDVSASTFEANGASGAGGAVWVSSPSTLRIVGSTFTANTAFGDGGAIWVSGQSEDPAEAYELRGNTFTDNSSGNSGGAVYVGATDSLAEPTQLDANTFVGNTATVGGALGVEYAAVAVAGGQFSTNAAVGGAGGAIASGGGIEIDGVDLDGNTAATDGGAVATNGPTVIMDSSFTNNVAEEFGGALALVGSDEPTVTGSTITGNRARRGGAIWRFGDDVDVSTNTISDNGDGEDVEAITLDDLPQPESPTTNPPTTNPPTTNPPTTNPPTTNPPSTTPPSTTPPTTPGSLSSALHPLVPARLVDTRPSGLTVDGRDQGGGRYGGRSTTAIQIAGRGGVDADAVAVAVNSTVVGPDGGGFVTLFPCDADLPTASSLNYRAGQLVGNSATVKLSATGTVCAFTQASTHFVLDVTAWFAADDTFSPFLPARLLETRVGEASIDGRFESIGPLPGGSVTAIQMAGRAGVPDGADAIAINSTVVRPQARGFITLFPCGSPQPTASSLNYGPGQVVGNSGVVALGDDGSLCVFTSAETELIIDVNSSINAGTGFEPIVPLRLLESRDGDALATIDGRFEGDGRLAAGSTLRLDVAGRSTIDADATAVALNTTAIGPSGTGYVTLYPCDEERPTTSSLNYATGTIAGNAAIVKLAADGQLCIYTEAEIHLTIDVNAVWTN